MADARQRWFDGGEAQREAGANVVLTLDEKIQYIAERELAAAIAKTHAMAGTVMVMNPNTGEILALANWPKFNPNAANEAPAEARMNRAVAALYEPGSTFKLITLAAAFDQGITRPGEVFDCENGAVYVAGTASGPSAVRPAERRGDLGAVERRGRHQDCASARGAEILRLHSRVWFWAAHRGGYAGGEQGAPAAAG